MAVCRGVLVHGCLCNGRGVSEWGRRHRAASVEVLLWVFGCEGLVCL
jgi:hypothetical protein